MATLEHAKKFCQSADLASLVQRFNFENVDPSDVNNKEVLTGGLAPSFRLPRTKMSTVISGLPEDVQIMLVAALKSLPEERTWDNVLSAFQNNPVMAHEGNEVIRADQILKSHRSFLSWKLPGGHSLDEIIEDVSKWYKDSLVKDDEVVGAIGLDIGAVAQIIAKTADAAVDLRRILFEDEGYLRPLLDVSGLLLPDEEHPYFKMFRLTLTVTSKFDRLVGVQNDQNGLSGVYTARIFKPRDEIINTLNPENRSKALSQSLSLFDD